jgi:hypothetical protein
MAILEQMAATVAPPVEGYGIAGQKAPQEAGKVCIMAAQEQMSVFGDKRPGKTIGTGLHEQAAKPLNKAASVVIILEYIGALYAPDDDVLK